MGMLFSNTAAILKLFMVAHELRKVSQVGAEKQTDLQLQLFFTKSLRSNPNPEEVDCA